MTADNRTSVQIVADALRSMPEAERDDDRDPAVVVAEYAVAALVAAQCIAPQASKKSCGPCRRGQHGCCDGNEYLRCECSHGAATALPSSGVDEDDCWHEANCRCVRAGNVDEEKLAEVRKRLDEADNSVAWAHGDAWSPKARKAHNDLRAAVAEWLKGQGVGKY